VSDRQLKREITSVDSADVLTRLKDLPLATWRYETEPDGVRHLGPMAQDFRAAFGLGTDDRTYHAVDAHGVAFAALQALERLLRQERDRVTNLERENDRLRQRIERLEKTAARAGSRIRTEDRRSPRATASD
jgi:hypothetical protein